MKSKFIEFGGFDWDSGNLLKAQKHGLSLSEIETFFNQAILVLDDPIHSKTEKRLIAVGKCKNSRIAFVVFTFRKRERLSLIRVISARYVNRKENEIYEKLKKTHEKGH